MIDEQTKGYMEAIKKAGAESREARRLAADDESSEVYSGFVGFPEKLTPEQTERLAELWMALVDSLDTVADFDCAGFGVDPGCVDCAEKEAENARLCAELEQERERRRVFMCGYCGESISRVEPGEAPGQEQVAAFAAHDSACPKNPLAVEVECLRGERDAACTAATVARAELEALKGLFLSMVEESDSLEYLEADLHELRDELLASPEPPEESEEP